MRASHDSDLLELELTRRQIPFVKYGGLRYLEAAHVKDLIALFRLVGNPANELSWFRVLQLLEGVGPVTARRVLDSLIAGQAGGADGLAGWARAREQLPASVRELGGRPDRGSAHRARRGRNRRRRRGAARRAGAAGQGAISRWRLPARRPRPARGGRARVLRTSATSPPSSRSTRRNRVPISRDRPISTRITWCCQRSTPPRASNGGRCTCSRCTTATSRRACRPGTSESIDEERRLLYVAMTRARRRAAPLRAGALLPPAARNRRRARVRQALAVLDRRGAAHL